MDSYVVIEIQTSANDTVSTLVTTYDNFNVAQQKYHTILAAAAVSDLPCHSAAILTQQGYLIESRYFSTNEPNNG